MLQSHYTLLPPSPLGAAAPAGEVIVKKVWNGKEMTASKVPTHTFPQRVAVRAGKAAREGGNGGKSWRALVRYADTKEVEAKAEAKGQASNSQKSSVRYLY